MFNPKILKAVLSALAISSVTGQIALADYTGPGTTTLRDPLVPGAEFSIPGVPPPLMPPPPVGDGPTPIGVTPGMTGPPTLLPTVPDIPSNQIDQNNSIIPMPFTPAMETPPGVLGPALTPFIPHSPSTPGVDPGMLEIPPFEAAPGNFNTAEELPIIPTGGLPGVGGLAGLNHHSRCPPGRAGYAAV